MKLLKLSLSLIVALLLFSCGKDDSCDTTSLADTIVGKWEVIAIGQSQGEVEFISDGTLIDENDALISGEINGTVLDEKSYTISNNELISLRAAAGSNFIDADITITSFTCDQIQAEVFSIAFTFERI